MFTPLPRDRAEILVNGFYRSILKRNPTDAEYSSKISLLVQGLSTPEQVRDSLFASEEYKDMEYALSNHRSTPAELKATNVLKDARLTSTRRPAYPFGNISVIASSVARQLGLVKSTGRN